MSSLFSFNCTALKYYLSTLPNWYSCLGVIINAGADLIGHYEGANFGITWANVFEDEFSMAWIIGLLLIDTFLYAALAWYAPETKHFLLRPAYSVC